MKLIWSEQARQEWAEQYRFCFSRNPEAARRMRERVMDGARLLREQPRVGRPGRVEGTREMVITGSPFLLVYDENSARVEIIHVYHGRQNWTGEADE